MPHDEEAIISPATAVNANGCDFALVASGIGEGGLETEFGIVKKVKTERRLKLYNEASKVLCH
jgi:hypothetical protein